MVLASAVLTVGSVFVFSFASLPDGRHRHFCLNGNASFRHSGSGHRSMPRATRPSSAAWLTLLAIAPALMLLILAGSFFIFFFLPRVSSRYLSAYTPTSDVSTGFTDRLQLGRIGQIQQSSAVVMHIEIQNDAQGLYDLKWRGVALNVFDGRTGRIPSARRQLRSSPTEATSSRPPRKPHGTSPLHPLPRSHGAARHKRFFPRRTCAQHDRKLSSRQHRRRRRRLQPRSRTLPSTGMKENRNCPIPTPNSFVSSPTRSLRAPTCTSTCHPSTFASRNSLNRSPRRPPDNYDKALAR